MEEQAFMVCMRVEDLEVPAEGSTKTACVECGRDVWVSPESKKVASAKGAMPVCSVCALELADEHTSVVEEIRMPGKASMSEGQLEEVAAELRRRSKDNSIPEPVKEWLDSEGVKEMDMFDRLKWSAEQAMKMMEAEDDDWGAVAVIEGFDGRVSPPVPLSDWMAVGIPKEIVAEVMLPGIALTAMAKRVVLGLSSWALKGDTPGVMPEYEGSLADHPDAIEMLVLIETTGDGITRIAYSEITRGSTGPELSEWDESKDPTGGDGLFVHKLVPALKLIKMIREKKGSDS